VYDQRDAHSLRADYAPATGVGRSIRAELRQVLPTWGLGEHVVEDVLTVAEEFVANVLDHAGSEFRIVVVLSNAVLRLEVSDRAAGLPRVQSFDRDALRGRGLQLVDAVAIRWGVDQHEVGKTVWADVAAA
jgi:anti-sigma regulatory factor (Ser/Thr protein kinase)